MKFCWLKAEKRIKYFRTYFHFFYLSFGELTKLKLKDIKSDSIYWLIDLSSEFILYEVLHSMRLQGNLGVGYDRFFVLFTDAVKVSLWYTWIHINHTLILQFAHLFLFQNICLYPNCLFPLCQKNALHFCSMGWNFT